MSMSVIMLGKSIKKDSYILEIDKETLEKMEDFLFGKILEQEKDEYIEEREFFQMLKEKKNENKNN